MAEFAGNSAFISGAAGGIGASIALAFARRGANVALADIEPDRCDAVAEEISALGVRVATVRLDVARYEDWDVAFDAAELALGPISFLVNNAGIGGGGNVIDEDPVRWRRIMDVNALGTFHGCRSFLPRLRSRGASGHIVNMASLSGLRSNPGMSAYTASKFAIVGLSDALRLELGDGPVGLSIVYPGMTNTRFVENSRRQIEAAGGEPLDESKSIGNIHELGMNPNKLAERVLNGVAAREYHIFTHADWKASIQAVFEDRLAAFGENADPDYHEDIASLHARIARMQEAQ